jgi:hypothetical protein
VWGQIISVVIIPSFLAITYLGQSIDFHLIRLLQFIVSSYLPSDDWCKYIYTTPIGGANFLGRPVVCNKFHPVHGREYPGDGLDRVQDPQGVLGS